MRALVCLTLAASLLACDEEYGPGPATPIILTSPPVHAVPPPERPLSREPLVQAVEPPAPEPVPAVVAPPAPEPIVEPVARSKPVPTKKKKKTVKR